MRFCVILEREENRRKDKEKKERKNERKKGRRKADSDREYIETWVNKYNTCVSSYSIGRFTHKYIFI